MSLKQKSVIDAVCYYYKNLGACAGRSSHALGHETTELCVEARESFKTLINANKSEEIIWTKNTTESMNLIANAMKWKEGDKIITTNLEHHSGSLPFHKVAQEKKLEFSIVEPNNEGIFDIEKWEEAIDRKTKLISLVHVSNFTGTISPVKEITKIAHDNGALVLSDCAQSIPHMKIDVKELDVDFIAASIHKMCGPTGMGMLYGKEELLEDLDLFLVGGDTIKDVKYENKKITPTYLSPPEKFEAGLQNYAGIIGSGAAAQYLMKIGMENIHKREKALSQYLLQRFMENQDIDIIGSKDIKLRTSLISFRVNNVEAALDVGRFLDEGITHYQIMVRAGAHCVHPFHYHIGISPKQGTTRASLYLYNTFEEIDILMQALEKFIRHIK